MPEIQVISENILSGIHGGLYIDIGATLTKVARNSGKISYHDTQGLTLEDLPEIAEVTKGDQLFIGMAAKRVEDTFVSNDVSFLNRRAQDFFNVFPSVPVCLNDVEAAGCYVANQYGGASLVFGLGTGTSHCFTKAHRSMYIIQQGEYGFCQSHMSTSKLVRDIICAKHYKQSASTYIAELAFWIGTLSAVYVPDQIVMFGGIARDLEDLGMECALAGSVRQSLVEKGSLTDKLLKIPLFIDGSECVLKGLQSYSRRPANFILG